MADFVCIGDATQDNFFFISEATVECDINRENCVMALKYGGKVPVERYAVNIGGNAANVACGLAKLGAETALLTTFGDDDRGVWIKKELMRQGVDLALAVTEPGRESNISTVIVYKGERTILTYHGQGADLEKVPEASWIYLTSSSGVDSGKLFDRVLEYKKTNGDAKLAFNPGTGDLRKGKEFLAPILGVADVLIVNKEEGEMLGGVAELGIKIVAVTDGANGAMVYAEGTQYSLPAATNTSSGTAGAGDAFSSGFLAALYFGKDAKTALAWGIKNSGSVVQKVGSTAGLLTKEQIERSG